MFNKLLEFLGKLVQLAQERNLLELEQLSELRDIHKLLADMPDNADILKVLKEIEAEQDKQTDVLNKHTLLLGKIVDELLPPQPGFAVKQRFVFAVPK